MNIFLVIHEVETSTCYRVLLLTLKFHSWSDSIFYCHTSKERINCLSDSLCGVENHLRFISLPCLPRNQEWVFFCGKWQRKNSPPWFCARHYLMRNYTYPMCF